MPNKIKVGDKAPDFTLSDTDLKLRSLRDFLGHNVVLAFFISAFTFVCTKEMCAFRDSTAQLSAC
jgi:peroxiredoxin